MRGVQSIQTTIPSHPIPDLAAYDLDCLDKPSLKDVYYKYFFGVPANSPERVRKAFHLRHQVYCVDRAFEPTNPEHPDLEFDAFDAHSLQSLLIHRPTLEVAGAVRLVLPRPESSEPSLPIQLVCSEPMIRDPRQFPLAHVGEISRFCISRDFRRRVRDQKYAEDTPLFFASEDARRVIPHLTLGLIEQLLADSIANDLHFWCAEMEPTLLRLLGRLGIHFDPIGPLIDYHGVRQPCMIRLDRMLDRVQAERPDVWEIIAAEGRHRDDVEKMIVSH